MKKKLKDYFVPNKNNDYRPHSLQKAAVVGMTFMVLLSFAVANLHSIVWISSDWLVSTILPAVIVDMTNDERAESSLRSLRRSSVLDTAARLKAEHMAANEYFAHNSPDGVTPWYWFGQANYNFVHAGENLAIHFTDSGDVVEAWMESPTHRANIMNGNYAEIGVGTAEGEYEGFKTVYVVQLFGTPAATASVAGETTEAEPEVAVSEPEIAPAVATTETPAPEEEPEPEPEPEVVLAESAEVTETVEFFEAEPELVEVETEETTPQKTDIVNMEVTENGVALFSDFMSTSTGGTSAPLPPESLTQSDGQSVSWIGSILTRPHIILEILYSITAAMVLFALMMAVFIEVRRQEPVQVAYAALLLLMMYGLFELHTKLSGGALIV